MRVIRVFFFQAEDGIRDIGVTGVQTCALPIFVSEGPTPMDVHLYAWIITVGLMVLILAFDVLIIGRRPHEPSTKEASTWIGVYVALAIIFGLDRKSVV